MARFSAWNAFRCVLWMRREILVSVQVCGKCTISVARWEWEKWVAVAGYDGMARDMAVRRRSERERGANGRSGRGEARRAHTAQVVDNTYRLARWS
ncbi:MAG: hypothetical protein ACJ71W_00850 [Terriglobales bacterium]